MKKTQKRAMMRASDHPYFVPPHCNARSSVAIDGIKTAVLSISTFIIFSRNVRFRLSVTEVSRKERAMRKKLNPPTGRLI
jgi:hypothetical protein